MVGSHAVILNNQAFDKRKKRRGREGVINGCTGLGAVLVLLLARDCPFAMEEWLRITRPMWSAALRKMLPAARVCDVFADASVSIEVAHDPNVAMLSKFGNLLLQVVPVLCVFARFAAVAEVALDHKNWLAPMSSRRVKTL